MTKPILWPVTRGSAVTQYFAENPAMYLQFGLLGHNGIDFGVVTGTPVMAVSGGVVVGSVNPAKATDAKTIALVQQDTDPTNASGYGKVWYGGGKDWLWGKNDASDARYPLGVAEINLPLWSFRLSAGATISETVTGNPEIVFADAAANIADTEVMVPYGWGNRTLKLTIWWWTGGTGNVYWVSQIRRLQAGGGLSSTPTYDGSAIVGANDVIAKTTITYSGTANIVEGEALKLRICRHGTHASDTRAASAFLLAAKVSVVD